MERPDKDGYEMGRGGRKGRKQFKDMSWLHARFHISAFQI